MAYMMNHQMPMVGAEEGYSIDVEDKSSDKGEEFFDVADVSMMNKRAETQTILQSKHVHEAHAVQHNADQEGCDEHDAAAGQDRVDDFEDATQVPEVERQTRPRKPPDAGCLKLKKFGPVLLKTGFMLTLLMLMMTNPILRMKGSCTRRRTPWVTWGLTS